MQAISDWWHSATKEEKFIQFVVFFFAFGYSSIISGSFLGIPMGLACLYIVYDCVKKRSLAGFYMPVKDGRGLWLFLAMGIHGMLDAGITYKGAARLLYLQLGLSLGYGCGIHRAEHL